MSDFHFVLEELIPGLMRYATALTRDVDTAEDLVADTIREALDHPSRHHGDAHVSLLTILHDLRGNPFRAMTLPAPVVSEADALLTLSDLDRALDELAEEHRAAILLLGLEGLSYTEAAAVMDVTPSIFRSRAVHARAELRRLMNVRNAGQTVRPATRKTPVKKLPCARRIAA